jgi:hypothetical protein
VNPNSSAQEQNLSLFSKVQTTLELSTRALCAPEFKDILKTRLALPAYMSLAFLHTGPVEEIRSDLNVISMTNIAPILVGVMVIKCGAVMLKTDLSFPAATV